MDELPEEHYPLGGEDDNGIMNGNLCRYMIYGVVPFVPGP